MALERLRIHHLRNIQSCDLQLSSGFNFLIGGNGSGKTSVLEAIYYLGHGRSFRSAITGRVIQYEQDRLVVHGAIQKDSQPNTTFSFGIAKSRDGSTEVKIGSESGAKLAQLAEVLPMQLITPEGFELLTGGPKFRRAFIDWGVFHQEPQFYSVWSRLRRLIKQRNALLRTATDYKAISYWDAELVPLVVQIDKWRSGYLEQLSPHIQALTKAFLPDFDIRISYRRGWDKHTHFTDLLREQFERDKAIGYTVSGPHKADLSIRIGSTPVDDVLSRGQLKLMMCALRLAQGQQLTQTMQKQCIYLIDDFASELDNSRRLLLAQALNTIGAQVFMTAISADQVSDMNDGNNRMFQVEQGRITEN